MNLNGAYPYRVQYEDHEGWSTTWAYCLEMGKAKTIANAMNKLGDLMQGKFFVYDVKEGKRI